MIEVGEYARTKNGIIFKTTEYWVEEYNKEPEAYTILKHSPNIIDLIEEGDYVNGKYICSIGTAIGNLPIINHTDGTFTPSNLIESIVTKEQFASMEYKIEE